MWEEEEDEQELCALLEQCGRWKSMQRASGDWHMYVLFFFFFSILLCYSTFFFFISGFGEWGGGREWLFWLDLGRAREQRGWFWFLCTGDVMGWVWALLGSDGLDCGFGQGYIRVPVMV